MTHDYRQEIIAHWGIQESLLQQYRVIGIAHQAIIAAGILVILSTLESNLGLYAGFNGQKVHISNIFWATYVLKIAIYIILLGFGWIGTFSFSNITKERASYVTFFQNLLLMCESNKLEYWLEQFECEEGAPFFNLLRGFQGKSDLFNYNIGLPLTPKAKEFIEYNRIISKDKKRHHITRSFIGGHLFDVFHLVWSFLLAYLIFFIWMSLGCILY